MPVRFKGGKVFHHGKMTVIFREFTEKFCLLVF